MNRAAMIAALEAVSPALSSNDMVPLLTHFRFSGKRVLAFNDHIGLSAPCPTDFVGCVAGSLLLSLLKASKAKEVEFSQESEETLQIKLASSKLKVGMRSHEDYPFAMPKMDDDASHAIIGNQAELVAGLDACMRIATALDTDTPEKLGVTVLHEGKKITLYSTDGNSMCQSVLMLKSDPAKTKPRFILSAPFCTQVLKLAKHKFKALQVHKDYSMLSSENGTTLYGRLIDSERPLEFDHVFQHHFGKDVKVRTVNIPTKLQGALERACIIASSPLETINTKCTVQGGKAKFYTRSELGEATDTVQLEEQHPDATIAFDPKLLRRAAGHYEKIIFTKDSIAMTSAVDTYLVSAHGGKEK